MKRLTLKEKQAISAFLAGKEADEGRLCTDGHRLDGKYIGGLGIARKLGDYVDLPETGSKFGDFVQCEVLRQQQR